MFQQEATCGLQVCQHPLCWATNRQAARGLLHRHDDQTTDTTSHGVKPSLSQPAVSTQDDDQDEDIFEGLPTVTLFNMLDDYGYDRNDRYPSTRLHAAGEQDRGIKSQKSMNIPPEGGVPPLSLNELKSHSAEEVTAAPANTPLQSSHGFGDYHDYHSPLGHNKYGSHKPAFTVSATASEMAAPKVGYHRVKLEMGDSNAVGLKPKKVLVWCPDPRSRKRTMPYMLGGRKPEAPPFLKAVSLPLNTVPVCKSAGSRSHKAARGTIPRKPSQHQRRRRGKREMSWDETAPQQAVRATPQEISQLRKVPVDVLIRVLHQAEEKGVITKKQTAFLLSQVAGKKEKLPSIQETKKVDEATPDYMNEPPKGPLETRNMRILDEAQCLSPRTAPFDPVYKLDPVVATKMSPETRRHLPAATATTEYGTVGKPITPIVMPGPQEPFLPEKEKVEDQHDNDMHYNVELRKVAAENLRNIETATREGIPSPKKTPVRYVATVFDDMPHSPPIKPFHYPRSPRDIFLGPIPSPPPPSPPTERDSAYDEQAGGSTMLVHPSTNGPSTITSLGEKTSSPSGSKTPTTGRDGDKRHYKPGMNALKKHRSVASPYGSSSGPDAWPQLNEEDFLRTTASSELAGSPIPSYIEDEIRAVSRNESASSATAETPLPDKFQNLQRGEIHSPAPPPPSPEPMRVEPDENPPPSTRAGGAATALGIITLAKSSSETSPETGGGLTPTPVVSSVTSGVETPLGRTTRAQRLGSTPAIAETPYENDSEEADGAEKGERDVGDGAAQADDEDETVSGPVGKSSKEPDIMTENAFETNISPELAKEELEMEIKKLDIT